VVHSFDFNIVKLGDGVVATAHDITERRRAERERFENAELLRIVLDNSRDATTRFAPDLRVEYVNRRVVELSGLGEDRWIGHTLDELGFPSDAVEAWSNHVRRVFQTGQPEVFEYDIDTTVGHLWAEASLAPEFGPDGRVAHVVSTDRDVTDRKRAEDELRQLATHDPLTGLANRSALLEEITRSLHAARRSDRVVAALMLDLDHFKNVNDSLGHSVGDEIIRAAAERIQHGVRAGDFVARPGGDEFVVVMRDLDDPTEAVRTAQRLLHDVRGPFSVHGSELFTTASIGIAVSGRTGDADDLLREADTALYVANDDGRDRLSLFNEEPEHRCRPGWRSRAIASRPGSGRTGRVVPAEIDLPPGCGRGRGAARWPHPSGSCTPPTGSSRSQETGLILDIGNWVLRTAFAQAAAWARSAPDRPLTVRVNLSAIQLSEVGLLDAVDAALRASGTAPAGVCVEITETSLLRESSKVRANLIGLRGRGIRVAVDDFGTGYSSLAYLREYPVDVLKVDRSFVTSTTTRTDDQRLVAGIASPPTA
jgi:diguanylate cyclase (GGDEF)-like protein/PAS domain S-box-containing protein